MKCGVPPLLLQKQEIDILIPQRELWDIMAALSGFIMCIPQRVPVPQQQRVHHQAQAPQVHHPAQVHLQVQVLAPQSNGNTFFKPRG